MDKPIDRAQLDQTCAQIRDTLPPMWWALYTGCLSAGFNPQQALELVKAQIMSNGQTK